MKINKKLIVPMLAIIVLFMLAPAAQGASPPTLAREWQAADLGGSYGRLRAPSPLLWRDEFKGALQPGWTWINENPREWSLEANPGFLTIWTSPYPTGGQNLLIRPAPMGDFTIQTRLLFQAFENFEFAGLVLWQDEENFLQFGRAFCDLEDICVGSGIYFDSIQGGTSIDSNFATQVED